MSNNITKAIVVSLLLAAAMASVGGHAQDSKGRWSPSIPKTWDEQAMLSLELPLADEAASPKHISADYYYRIPVRPIYKSYPVYHPDQEPAGYLDSLRKQEPEI